ncbi:FlaA1/EpsC-like NDP-sugar epimerase [Mobilisporobacter senegalensis]|uniref:FlaA1/EpsC-like NDP-sugar epimerase n=1 Tax=Mobilisporobacter senegalensis TaxID=1329262 RepID=A0A3N1XRF5_9FIRM|nr:nucleoside-diphosphate sugar epimerase/dehydratase [Mobilisporobacter senegalensis]ROR29249.1 FlaA1/EpsC-like NDP-sugar epimerase [Mobilisporobacter senegalensis]
MITKKFRTQIIFIIDILIIFITCFILYYLIPNGSNINNQSMNIFFTHMILLILSISICQFLLRSYQNIWKYAESGEYVKLMLGVLAGYLFYTLINNILFMYKTTLIFSVASCAVSILLMLLIRFIYRKYRVYLFRISKTKLPLAIIGAGSAGVLLLNEIIYNTKSDYHVHCFFDDDLDKIGKKIRGVKVSGPIDKFNELIQNTQVREVIIAIPSLTEERKNEILEIVSKSNIAVKVLPDLISILQNGSNLLSSAREFNVNELLGRESVSFDESEINSYLNNKIIVVTGGGGSIGSELCRQIAKTHPAHLIIIDNYENNAYEIQQELIAKYKETLNLTVEIASVQDKEKLELLFERYQPEIVFHAAAHKHVPFMEDSPDEAIKNNIFGTYNTVQAANRFKVEKFVLISTDKAVNPTSMMGASKRFCEMIVQSMKNISSTNYVTVRFGNVLGSNGSVIPLFKRQIEQGGPVTITDKRAYRYFMTIPEAAQLVLRACSMKSQSETYVLDMGQPVNILTLAENLIKIMGYIPYTQIPIKEIGIRQGEKLNEELLMKKDELSETENAKIFIEKHEAISSDVIERKMEVLRTALETKNIEIIQQALINTVPTFKLL